MKKMIGHLKNDVKRTYLPSEIAERFERVKLAQRERIKINIKKNLNYSCGRCT